MARWTFPLALVLAFVAAGAALAADPASVPAPKRTPAGLYLTAVEAAAMKRESGDHVLFVDVRSRAEAMFVGMAELVDALVPFSELPERGAQWDESRGAWQLADNPRFLAELDARVAEQGLDHASPVIFMCRSGDRSARAVATAFAAGYVRAFSVVDGFEGDVSPAGRRDVNGWKNSGLPWSYRLEASKLPGR
jgi:rhodanese-related sulfurtransferase